MIHDEDLLLYHYGEGLAATERERIAAALAADAQLTLRLRQLLADLEAITSQTRVIAPAAVQARWAARLNAAAAAEPRPSSQTSSWRSRNWGAALAVSVAMALGVGIGLRLQVTDSVETVPVDAIGAVAAERPRLQRGLRLHFAETERVLVEVSTADATERAQLLGEVIEQNRLFALAAERANEDSLARVLRAFDALLLAMADETLDAQAVQSQGERLDFELTVMQTKLAQASSKPTLQL